MILDNFGSICYNGDSSTDELATIGVTMTIKFNTGGRGRNRVFDGLHQYIIALF